MSKFQVQDAMKGTAIGFSPSYPSVEISFDPSGCQQHGQTYVLTAALATEREIDEAINHLISDLKTVRELAVRQLEGLKQRARPK